MHVVRLIGFVVDAVFLNALGRKLSVPHFGLIDFHVTESQTVLNVSKGETKPTRADAHVNRVPEGKAKSLPVHGKEQNVLGKGDGGRSACNL